MSQYHFLSDDELTASFSLESRILRACEPDTKGRFFAITCPVDQTVVSECLDALNKLMPVGQFLKAYRQAGTSSVQIYLPFTTNVSIAAVRTKLIAVLGDSDCTFHGASEPFVLPLQSGFAWLNDDLTVLVSREELTLAQAVRKFMTDLEVTAIEPGLLDALTSPVVTKPACGAEVVGKVEPVSYTDMEISAPVETPSVFEPAEDDYSSTEQVLPIEVEALPSFPVDGGHQLLLFGINQKVERSELPKEITRRGKRSGQNAALAETSDELDGLKLFPVIENAAASGGTTKRRSVTAST